MRCNSCGATLPPGAASCPVCGAPTPYNVTGGSGNSAQYDKTVAASPYGSSTPATAYGSPSQGTPPPASNPYNSPNPYGQSPDPYGTPQGNYGTPPQGNFAAPPPPPQQQYIPPQQQYVPPAQPQYTPPEPRKRNRTGLIIGIGALVLLIILVSVIGAVVVNGQHQASVQATATAQTNQTATVQAQAKATANANATATAIVSNYPFSNKVVVNDPLVDNSKGYGWDEGSDSSGGSCKFTSSGYHAIETQTQYFDTCFAKNARFSDFTFQVNMTILQGDRGGLLFRADPQTNKLYYFRVSETGTYLVILYVDSTGTNARILDRGTISGFHTGQNQQNTLGVVARGSSIGLYANSQLVNTITDSTLSSGVIGVASDPLTTATDVVYSNAMVWQLGSTA
jgi:hypothetical protein